MQPGQANTWFYYAAVTGIGLSVYFSLNAQQPWRAYWFVAGCLIVILLLNIAPGMLWEIVLGFGPALALEFVVSYWVFYRARRRDAAEIKTAAELNSLGFRD